MTDYPLSERAQRTKDAFELPVLIAALFIIPVILIEERSTSEGWVTVGFVLNWLIWGTFVAEFVTMIRLVDDKWRYAKSDWLDVVIIVVSFPALPLLLASLRVLRVVRLASALRVLHLVKLAAVMTRAALSLRRLFHRAVLKYALAVSALLALGFGAVIAIEEPEVATPLDGIWWAFVTLTTVGYGDIAPASPVGRGMAIILIMLGIGVIAIITAAVAARFVEEDEAALVQEVARIHARLDELEQLLVAAEENARLDRVVSHSHDG